MWFKTFDRLKYNVKAVVFLDSDGYDDARVTVHAMYCEWHLIGHISFEQRDDAYAFIRHCTRQFVQEMVDRLVYDTINGGYVGGKLEAKAEEKAKKEGRK